MRIESIKIHLAILGVTLERYPTDTDKNRWVATLQSTPPEKFIFSSAAHALRYWSSRSRDQVSMLAALEVLAREDMTDMQVKDLQRWSDLEIALPDFLSSALNKELSRNIILSPSDLRHLCETHGPIYSSWLTSSLRRRQHDLSMGKDVISCTQWIWGQLCDQCDGCRKQRAPCKSSRAIHYRRGAH